MFLKNILWRTSCADIGGILDHHCLNFLIIMNEARVCGGSKINMDCNG
jgi:hypothetical protein